jgi:hypothetical protein
MVDLIPTSNNPSRNEIDAYICEMLNMKNYDILNDVAREIQYKYNSGALLHPAEEHFVNYHSFFLKALQQREKQVA